MAGIYKVGASEYGKEYRLRRVEEYCNFMDKQLKERGYCVDCGTTKNLCFVRKDGKRKRWQSLGEFAKIKKDPNAYFFRCQTCNLKAHHLRKGWKQHPPRRRGRGVGKVKGLKQVIAETYPTCKNCPNPSTHIFRADYQTIKLSQKELKMDILDRKDMYFGCCNECYPRYQIAKRHYKTFQNGGWIK